MRRLKPLFPRKLLILLLVAATAFFSTCNYENTNPDFSGYPDDVGKLIFTKCAVSGCHTSASKEAAGGLSMQSWNALFEGGHSGAALIPYRSDFSTMCYFTNTFPDLGVALSPTMPYNRTPLTRNELLLLKHWIDAGAPDKDHFIKFSDNGNRAKYYVANQGCNAVTVFDAASGLQMRCITTGQGAPPNMVKVSPDKKYWYVISSNGTTLEKYSAENDQLIGSAVIGAGAWNGLTISDNSQTAYCSDLSLSGKIAVIDLNTLAVTIHTGFDYAHGIALDATNDTLYVTQQIGSNLYKIPVNDFSSSRAIPLYTGTAPALPLNPHAIIFSPDRSKYFVSCQGSPELRVFEANTDRLLNIIPIGASPTEMCLSPSKHYLFVACTEDTTSFPGKRGSIAVIDYTSNTLVKYIYSGWQPHGIAMDEIRQLVIVANRNYATDGPTPHHESECGGRNGYITSIDLNTLETVKNFNGSADKKVEVSVDPYSVEYR